MLYIQNRADSTLGVIEDFYNDTHQMILSSGVSSYTFTVAKNIEDSQYLVEGNYVIITDDQGLGWKFTIMNTTQTHTEITVYCEDIGLELVNKVMDTWSAPTTKQPASYYINKAIKDTKWKIGFNQISNLSRTLKWEGRDTSLNRLLSICTEFDHAEIEFRVKFHNLQVTDYIINIYKSRGANRSDIQLVYGETVDDITKSSSIEELATAMMGVGSDKELPENAPQGAIPDKVTFKNLTYDDGFFFTKMGDPFLRARVANQQFNLREGYIEDYYEYDTSDPQELLNRTITQLKERSEIKVNYEVSAVKFEKSLQLGDTITIIDHDYKPELLLSGRVLELDKSYTDASQDKLVLGNFLILYSNINDKLYNLQNQIKNMKVDSNYMWLRYAIDDKGTGMSATPTAGTKYLAMLVNKKTGIPSDNPADYAGHWKLIQGADGKDGIPGATGADGKTSYTHFAYANNVSGTTDFSLDDPTGRSYMGVYSDFTKADSNDPSDYVWSLTKGESGPEGMQGAQGPKGDIGIPGKPGADGKTSYTHVAYADNDNGGGFSQNPTNKAYMGWYSDFTANDSTDTTKYAWSLIKGSDGLDGAQGIPGPKGADGKTPYTHIAYADTATGSGLSQLPDSKKYIGMYVDFTENDSSDPQKYAWSLIKGADGKDGTPGKDGIAGKDGIGIKSTTVTYQASSNGTTAPTGAWTANVPTVPAGQYLWTRTIWTYTDNTNETSYSVAYVAKDGNSGKDGIAGKDGVGIKSTAIAYATSTSGTVTPTTGWVTNPPAVSPGQFMWTKTVWNYTDNSSETGYSVAQAGNTGATGPVGKDGIAGKDGVGIKSTAIAYAQSTSGTTPPTTGWTAGVPTLIKGQYLWTKTVWTYTDSSAETGYTVSYNAKDGNTGADGVAGKDGTGIKSTVIEYVGAVSGTSKPVNGWSATIPTVPAGQYLWTRTTWQYTDGTSEQGFTNALMGRTGPKGDTGAQGLQGLQGPTGTQGIAGPKGADGKTQYTHIAYANSADGITNFSTSDSNRTYVGMYVDFNVNDSTAPSDYSWTLVKGADGSQGTPGKAGADGKTPYLHTAYSWSADGTDRFMTVYPGENLIGSYQFDKLGRWRSWGDVGAGLTATRGFATEESVPIVKVTSTGTGVIADGYGYAMDFIGANQIGKTGDRLTLSLEYKFVKGNPNSKIKLQEGNGSGGWQNTFGTWEDNDSWHKLVLNETIDSTTGDTSYYVGLSGSLNADTELWVKNPKLEKGENKFPVYTPSPLDDPEGAYPKFIGTYTDYIADDSTDPSKYTWAKLRGEQGLKGDTGEDGVAGKDGVGIESTQIMYAQNNSGTTAPTTGWTAQVPTLIKGQYLWTQTTWLYTDSTGEAGYTVSYNAKDGNTGANGIAGKDGVGIKSTLIEYVVSSSGITKPTTGWSALIPSVTAGQFLWTRTTWRYTDSTNEVGYSVAQAGATGPKGDKGDSGTDGVAGKDGIGIKSTAVSYQASTNGTTAPTGTWSTTVPTVAKGSYLWTRTIWTYTDNTTETGYSVAYVGTNGNDGTNGVAGKDGVGMKSTTITYAQSTSGTVAPTTGYTTTVPSVASGSFLWTKTTWSYTDGTSESGYSVAKMGEKGAQGPQGLQGLQGATGNQGIQGLKGLDGKSSYTHIAYGTSNSGAGFTQTTSTSTTYIGMYVDQTATDSGDPNKYAWSLIKGADGTQGTPGAKGADGKTPYFHSAWANSVDGKTGFSTTDSVNKSYLGTYTDFTVADSADPTKYAWSLIKGADGINGKDGIPGKPGADGRTPYFHTAWADSTDGKINFSLTDATNRGYLGTYTDFTQADSTDTTKYAWSLIKGRDGSDGAPGKPGSDGKTPYFHQAWADSKDGKINFSATDPTNRGYLGTYSDFTQADSTDPSKYYWVELVGNLQVGGRNYLADTNTTWQTQGSGGTNQTSSPKWLFTFGTIKQAPFNDGDYVTLSFDYTNVGTGAYGTILPQFNNTPWGQLGGGDAMKDNGHVVRTVQWKSDWTTSGTATGIQIRIDNVATTRTVIVYDMQFERGNKATDYKQAPEDTQALIDSISNPNLVYNAGFKGDYQNGFDGWSSTEGWYRTTNSASMHNGANGVGINQDLASTPGGSWVSLISKPHSPIDVGTAFSLSVWHKVYIEGSTGMTFATLNFYDSKGTRVGYKDTNNVDNRATSTNRNVWVELRADNIVAPAGAVKVGVTFQAHATPNQAGKIHAVWSAPIISIGSKPAQYTDNQGNGADISRVNEGLEHVEGLYNSILTPIASVTTPTNPKTGQQWWVLDTNGKTVGLKIWDGSTWTDATIQQSAMNIGTLNGNTINGATINSSNFNVAFDETKENTGRLIGPYFKGTQVIKNGSYLSDYQYKGTTQTGYAHLTPDGLATLINDDNGKLMSRAYLGLGVLELSEQGKTGVITGTLNAQDSYRNSTNTVAWLGGWGDWGSGRGLIHVVRNGRLVTLSGYPHHDNTTTLGNMFQLPAWAKPAEGVNISAVCYNGSVMNPTACRLFISDSGLASISNAQKGGWVVIGASYVGQDM